MPSQISTLASLNSQNFEVSSAATSTLSKAQKSMKFHSFGAKLDVVGRAAGWSDRFTSRKILNRRRMDVTQSCIPILQRNLKKTTNITKDVDVEDS